jgi:AAA domain
VTQVCDCTRPSGDFLRADTGERLCDRCAENLLWTGVAPVLAQRNGHWWPLVPVDEETGLAKILSVTPEALTQARDQDWVEPDTETLRPFVTTDLAKLAREGVKTPELLCEGMLYRGALHALVGDSGAGKTTILHFWAVLELAAGYSAVLLDEEDGQEQTTERLVALGATPEHLERLVYLDSPSRQWDDADRRGFELLLDQHRPRLVGYVSASAIVTMAGKNENFTAELIPIYKMLQKFSRESNAAGVIVDHVPLRVSVMLRAPGR